MMPLTWGRISAVWKADVRPGNSVVSTTDSNDTFTAATSGTGAGAAFRPCPLWQPPTRSKIASAARAADPFRGSYPFLLVRIRPPDIGDESNQYRGDRKNETTVPIRRVMPRQPPGEPCRVSTQSARSIVGGPPLRCQGGGAIPVR